MVRKGEIVDRFDTTYYSALNTLDIANNTIYPVKKLSEVTLLQRGKFSHRPRNDARFYNGEYPFIQTGDIVKASQNNDKIIFTQTLNELGLSVSKLFQPDILIITIAANIGDTAILTYPACFPDSLVTITPKNSEVSVRYLNVYFKYVKDYLVNLAPQSAQKNINLQQLSPTPVVIPPPEIQSEIISIFENAYIAKKQKEAEAAALLASIDGYLLQELGITLPPPSEKKTYFLARSSQVSGGRFDPFYYINYYTELEKSLNNGSYSLKKLNLICKLQNGYAFKSNDYIEDSGTLNIRMSNIRPNNNFDPDYNIKYLPDEYSEIYKDYLLNDGDILIAMTDMAADPKILGVPTIVQNSNGRRLLLNQRVGKLYGFNKSIIDIGYLKEILGSKIIKEYFNKMGTRGVQINISSEQILSANIPLPPLEKQTEIADHISALRTQAKQLQQQAAAELAYAKQHVEQLILGE